MPLPHPHKNPKKKKQPQALKPSMVKSKRVEAKRYVNQNILKSELDFHSRQPIIS